MEDTSSSSSSEDDCVPEDVPAPSTPPTETNSRKRTAQGTSEVNSPRKSSRNSEAVEHLTEQPLNAETVATQTTEEIDEELEREFLPHMWSSKFDTPEDVFQNHVEFMTAESERATQTIPHKLDVTYGSKKGQKLDIFGTDLPDNAPILVYFHGGYWKELSKDTSRFPALSLYGAGVKTIVVGYGCRRKDTLWDIVDIADEAVCYVLRYAEEKGSKGVYLAGHCSGAHLIAKVLGDYELPDYRPFKFLNGVFLISGIYDLRKFCETSANDEIQLEMIDAVSMSPLYGNYAHLLHSRPRFYVIAAQEDSPTFKKQSRDFYDVLQDVCTVNNTYLEIKDGMDHYEIVQCFVNEDNYLKELILNDLRKHSCTVESRLSGLRLS